MYENQITGLLGKIYLNVIKIFKTNFMFFLGHNGAGKTTTTFMLCGE